MTHISPLRMTVVVHDEPVSDHALLIGFVGGFRGEFFGWFFRRLLGGFQGQVGRVQFAFGGNLDFDLSVIRRGRAAGADAFAAPSAV